LAQREASEARAETEAMLVAGRVAKPEAERVGVAETMARAAVQTAGRAAPGMVVA
jgi:hypothetical protein